MKDEEMKDGKIFLKSPADIRTYVKIMNMNFAVEQFIVSMTRQQLWHKPLLLSGVPGYPRRYYIVEDFEEGKLHGLSSGWDVPEDFFTIEPDAYIKFQILDKLYGEPDEEAIEKIF